MNIAVRGGTFRAASTSRRAKGLDEALGGIDTVIDVTSPLAGKRVQEEILSRATIPLTILRATHFFEFTGTAIAARSSPRLRSASRRAGHPSWPGPSPWISSTWHGESSRPEARKSA